MKLVVKKMYGLNDASDFVLDSNTKHSFVYGINASGKSSVANSVMNLINKKEYKGRFPYDSEDFFVNLKFDDLDIKYGVEDDTKYDIDSISDINQKVFVFNKFFIKDSLSIEDEGFGTAPEIGVRVAERSKTKKSKEKTIEEEVKNIKKKISETSKRLPSKIGDFYKISELKSIYSTKIETQEATIMKSFNNSTNEILTKKLLPEDFFDNNINNVDNFLLIIRNINNEIINSIKEKNSTNIYVISNKEDKDFYNQVLAYLNNFSGILRCPICLTTNIDVEKIKGEINNSLQSIISDEVIKKLEEKYSEIKNTNSYFAIVAKEIYSEIFNFEYPIETIETFSKDLDDLKKNYDSYLIDFCGIILPEKTLEKIKSDNLIIEEINNINKKLTNSTFIDEFDKMLENVFENDLIRAKSRIENDRIIIQLFIRGKEKEGKSIEEFFDIISESQKTKLSLAFFLSFITYKVRNSKILCIFDDPIDSYDSISKYKISRIIFEFISKRNFFINYDYDCYSVFLSHSVEYFRLFVRNFRVREARSNSYYIFSKIGLSEINYANLFVIDGDFNILDNLIKMRNDKSQKITIKEFISILPIIRELSKYSENNFTSVSDKLNIDTQYIADLNSYISAYIIHGMDINPSLLDILDKLNKYMLFDIDNLNYNNGEPIFDLIEKIIKENRNSKLEFYDEIILKNIIAIYIRAYYDLVVSKIIVNDIKIIGNITYNTISDVKRDNDLFTISSKITAIYKSDFKEKYENICIKISTNLTMLNDFGHSAGIYLTPLIDVNIVDLLELYDYLFSNGSVFRVV